MNEGSIAADLLAVLEVAVLERPAAGELRLTGAVPEWLVRFRPEAASGTGTLSDALGSPFLENFLIDAESFWASNASGRLMSGLWTETGPMGRDFHMEASAVCVGGKKILLIENRAVSYTEKQAVLQTARAGKLRAREGKRKEEPGSR
jgi:hypothetical protein